MIDEWYKGTIKFMIGLVLFFGIIMILLTISSHADMDKNQSEIGLRISNPERECYDFCDGGKYFYKSSTAGGMFSSGTPTVCKCRLNKVTTLNPDGGN